MKLISGKTLFFLASIFGLVTSDDSLTPKGKGAAVVEKVSTKIARSGIFPSDNKFLCRIAWVESKYGTDRGTYRRGYNGGIWQVDKIGYDDTVERPSLRKYHKKIQKYFRINWTATSWSDLQKPLYSGLAARLLLVTIPAPIPPSSDVNAQGRYWKKNYNRSGAGTPQKFVNDVKRAYGCAV